MDPLLSAPAELHDEARSVSAFLEERGVAVRTVAEDDGAQGEDAAIRLRLQPGRQRLPESGVLAVLQRDEPRDVLIAGTGPGPTLAGLPEGARVGVLGARRRNFLLAHRPDTVPVGLGNGHTPAASLDAGTVDAVVVGSDDARREGMSDRTSEVLDPKAWLPGAGQGAVFLLGTEHLLLPPAVKELDHFPTRQAVTCEHALLEALGVDGDDVVGTLALPFGRWLRLWTAVVDGQGRRVVRADLTGPDSDPHGLARRTADLLLARGAGALLKEEPA